MTRANVHSKDVVFSLNRLIGNCVDGERSFRLAAERENDGRMRSLFHRFAEQHAEFRNELRGQVARMGGSPTVEGTPVAEVRRAWATAKANVAGNSMPIVAECEKEEDTAKRSYEQTLDHVGLPLQVQKLVERQYVKVKEIHDRVRELHTEKQESERVHRGPWDGEGFYKEEQPWTEEPLSQ